jgi:hypothetical protein
MPEIQAKTKILTAIYADFDLQAAPFKNGAICRPGCAYCCTHFGRVDVTTLEGLAIHDWIESLPPAESVPLRQACRRNMQAQKQGRPAACPFLNPDRRCRIYPIRPFSCRRLYSLQPCEIKGPLVHRQVMVAAARIIQDLQAADAIGYSGHISVILQLLSRADFRRSYRQGIFNPQKIAAFGRSHGLIINRSASGIQNGPLRHHL